MIDGNYISERIAVLRNNKNISARDMSISLGQSPNYINNIENKKALPSMQMFLSICDFLEISPKEFFDEGLSAPNEFEKLMENFKRFDRRQLDILIALSKEMK